MGYEIKLDIFEGPLDLLLYLIKKNEIDIYNIPIAIITEQYLEYIDVMKSLNLDVAGEYLVMAATLIHIKSKMLLPVHDDTEDEEDPREALARQLLEYQAFKEAALNLDTRDILGRDVFKREYDHEDEVDNERILDEMSVFELVEAFRTIIASIKSDEFIEIDIERMSLSDKINEIMERLTIEKVVTFSELLGPLNDKIQIIYTFLALLELVKLRLIEAYQSEPFGTIRIFLAVKQ
ncbi:MAG: segregation/condensation protein A [Deltaproteobacteria bacterium]|nr:segregation/condensation protein A [Deltaproteobacteria bacterium]